MKLFQGYPDSVQDVGRGDQGLKLTPTGLMCPEFSFKVSLGFSKPAQQQSCVH